MTLAGATLARSISGPQFFGLAFGSVVGVAWIVVMGDAVGRAGPGGTAAALAVGGIAMLLVGVCYAEMAARLPAAGGEMVYAHTLGGAGAAYATGWTMALIYTAACAFEAISIGALLGLLFPGLEGPVLYRILGQDVHAGGLAAGTICALGLAALNVAGARGTALAQEWVTYLRIALMLIFLCVAVAYAEPANLRPLIPGATPTLQFGAFLSIVGTAPFWFAGFNVFATAAEESSTSLRTAGRAVVLAIAAAAVFYIVLVLAVAAMVPRPVLATFDLPAAQAFEHAMGTPVVARVVLITAILGNLSAWNALLMAGSRVYFALGRSQLSPPAFARLGRAGTPVVGIALMTVVTLAALPLGRGFVMPIVNLSSASFSLTYLVTCLALLKLRQTAGPVPSYVAPGGRALVVVAALLSAGIVAVALVQPWFASDGIPAEDYALAGWIVVAGGLWLATRHNVRATSDADRATLLRGHHALDPA